MNKDVSYIIVNYNGGPFLEKVVDSILKQNIDLKKMEVIIVDNNSTDKSIDKIKGSLIKIIKLNKNLGFAEGNNVGIQNAKGKYLALINNDLLLDKNWTTETIKTIEKSKNNYIVGNKIYLRDTNNIWAAGAKIYFPGFAKHLFLNKEKSINYVPFASVLIRKNKEVLDNNFFMYYEDSEYCKRIKKLGYNVIFNPNAKSYHFVKDKRASKHEEYYINRNRPYYYTKYYNFFQKTLFLIFDLVIFFNVFIAYRIVKNPNRIKYFKEIINARIDSIILIYKREI